MDRKTARGIAFVCIALITMLTGCGSVSYTRGDGPDNDSLNNAIAIDDVYTIRSAIQARVITPDQRIVTPGYSAGAPLLAIAARAGSLEVMRYLIAAGADLNARTPVGETPLMLAAFFSDVAEQATGRAGDRHEQAVRLLVSAGADLENLPHHYTPLSYAAYQGKQRIVRFLLERGAKVNADARSGMTYVNTPLMMAAIQGHEAVVRMLLQAGADADVRVAGGHTAAEFAAKYNHGRLAQLLLCAQRDSARSGGQCGGQILGLANP
jgi:ankyrin repeat protein